MSIQDAIAKAIRQEDLSQAESESAMMEIMSGNATPAQIGGYLVALRMKGETVDEIVGSARAMRANALRVPVKNGNGRALLDTAGTGGDGKHTFNISTAAAFVIAGHGMRVAKHGNRAASSQCGSADVLAELGVNLDLTPQQVGQVLEEVGIAFMYAPRFHPAMKHAVGPRREIGQRTIFNVLGPLTNPAGANVQLVGVYDPGLTEPIARTLGELGARAAVVVHGYGGTDELNPGGPNRVSHLHGGQVKTYDLDPTGYGIGRSNPADLIGGDPPTNAGLLRAVLSGKDRGPRRDAVLLNAAAALSAECTDLPGALEEARASIDSGKAMAKLDAMVAATQRYAAVVG